MSYKERTGVELLYSGNAPIDYTSLESTLFTWATQLSVQGIDAPIPSLNDPKFSDGQLADTFSLDSLAVNVNYLNLLPAKFNLPPLLSSGQLANLEDWARSAQAYVELAREWPAHDRFFPAATIHLAQVRSVGANLAAAIKAVAVKPDGSANNDLFSALQAFYSTKGTNLINALDAYERQFEVKPGAAGFDLWAGGSQQTIPAHIPVLLPSGSMQYDKNAFEPPPDSSLTLLSPPAGFESLLSQSVINANLLGRGLEIDWQVNPGHEVIRTANCVTVNAWITIMGYFIPAPGGVVLFPTLFRTMRIPDITFCQGDPGWAQLVYRQLQPAWESTLKLQFAAQSVPGYGDDYISNLLPDAQAGARFFQAFLLNLISNTKGVMDSEVQKILRSQQPAFYTRLLTDLTTKEPLRTPVRELSGASAAIGALATFGLQRSLDSDELLRTLLFGQERVPDADVLNQLFSSYSGSLTDPKSVNGTLTDRLTAALTEINTVIGQISSGSRLESSRAVDSVLDAIDRHSQVRLLPFATDVTGSVQITRGGFRYNHGTKNFVQTVSIKNVGGTAIPGPLTLALDLLRSGSGQNDTVLTNATGRTVVMAPLDSSYVTLNLGDSSSLSIGGTVSTTLTFSNTSQTGILYQARLLAGDGFR